MPYTNILRMCLSGLRRIPGKVAGSTHLMGPCQNLTPLSRLVTVRRYGTLDPRISISTSKREGPKKTKKTKKDTDPNKPKPPQSNYIIWFMETQGKIKEDNPGFTIIDIARKAGELWKGMSPEDKKPYAIRAAKLKKEFQEKMEEYNKTLKEEDTGLLEDTDSEQKGKSKPKKAKSKDNSPRKSVSDSKAGAGYSYESQEFISDSESLQGGHSEEDEDRPLKPYAILAAKLKKEFQEKMEEYNKTLKEEDTGLLEDTDSEQKGKSKPKKAKSKDNSPRKSVSDSKAGDGYSYESQEFISDSESLQGGHSEEDEDRPLKPYAILAAKLKKEFQEKMEEYNKTLKEEDTGLLEDTGSEQKGKSKPKKAKSKDNSPRKSVSDSKAGAGYSYESQEFISDSESLQGGHSEEDEDRPLKPYAILAAKLKKEFQEKMEEYNKTLKEEDTGLLEDTDSEQKGKSKPKKAKSKDNSPRKSVSDSKAGDGYSYESQEFISDSESLQGGHSEEDEDRPLKQYAILAAKLKKEFQEKMEEYNKTLKEEDTGLLEDTGSEQKGKSKPKKAKSKDNSPRKSVSDSKAGAGYSYESQEFISDSESSLGGHSDEDRPIKHGLFCTSPCLISVSNTQINRYSVASEESQESRRERRELLNDVTMIKFRNLVEEGRVQTLEPRIVTSLPEKFKRTGNETFVTFATTVIGKFPNLELFTISASSGSDNFHQVCKTTQEVTESLASTVGMVYNENTDQFLRDGKPVEVTGPKDALQQFIGFLKKHNKPVLVFYDKMNFMNNISVLMNKWGLLDDFISEVQYYFCAPPFVTKVIPKGDVEDLKLATICEKLMGLKLEQEVQIKRVDALHRLFTEHLQQKADEIEPIHTNSFYTKNSLIKMVVDGQINVITMDNLSRAGIGLDHLNFLAEKGSDEFVSCLVDRGLPNHVAQKLYSVCLRNKKVSHVMGLF